MDWNHLHAFLETAQSGSISAAARRLGVTQPTISRQLAGLERSLRITLFERVGRSVQITDAGLALLEHARAMGAAADELLLAATGQSQGVEGTVTISASDVTATWLLPPVLARLREIAPGIVIELLASNNLSDLRRREADIAVRHVPPQEPDLIGRLLREATAGFYASRDWVSTHGHPRTVKEALEHRFIGIDRSGRYLEYVQKLGLPLTEKHIAVICEDAVAGWELVCRGLGIGVMMDEVASHWPEVVRVIDELPSVHFPFWLVTHRELRTSRRIRVVFDALAQALAEPMVHAPAGSAHREHETFGRRAGSSASRSSKTKQSP